MADPAITKTWQFLTNQLTPNSVKGALLAYKNALTGVTPWPSPLQNPWSVVLCCNASAVSTSDNWSTTADITFVVTSGAHSWIVLQNVTGMQILFDCINHNNQNVADIRMSPRGLFTGGSTTTRPTATDELPEVGAANISGNPPYQKQWTMDDFSHLQRFHVWHTADGKQTMLLGFQQTGVGVGAIDVFWILGQAEEAHPGWTKPHVLYIGVQGNGANPDAFFSNNDWTIAEESQGKYQILPASTEGYFDGTNWRSVSALGKNGVSGQPPSLPIYLYSHDHRTQVGRWPVDVYGTCTDVAGATTGDFVPSAATKKFVKVNGLLLPWDGSSAFQWNT